jgi:hypothetical protein
VVPPPVKVIKATPLVTVPVTVPVTLLPQQEDAEGGSNVHPLPHCTVLLVGQSTTNGEKQLVTSARIPVCDLPGSKLEPLLVT